MSRLRRYRGRLIGIGLAILGVLALPYAGLSPTQLLNSTLLLTALAVVLGSVIQSTVMSLLLLIEGTWQVGDVLTVAGPAGPLTGTIVRQDFRISVLALPDGQRAAVPNAALWGATVLLGAPSPPVPPTTT